MSTSDASSLSLWRRRTALAFAAATLALVIAGCTSRPSPEAVDEVREPLRMLLRERARLLLAGDGAGYLAPMSPEARQAEESIARGALDVGLAALDFVVGDVDTGTGGALDDVEVDFIYRYEGLPEDNDFRFRRIYTVEPRQGSLVITGSQPTADPLLQAPIWATGPVEVTRSPHFVALTRPGPMNTEAILDMAEQARSRLVPKLTLEPDDAHLVLLARDGNEFSEFLSQAPPERPPGVGDTVSLAVARGVNRGRGPEERNMVADVSAIVRSARSSYEGRGGVTPEEVFQHELAHLTLLRFEGEDTPGWVTEGAAMFLSGERRVDQWREDVQAGFSGVSLAELSDGEELDGKAYGYANAAALYLIEEYGADTFWDFYQGIKTSGTSRMLRLSYKMDSAQLDDRIKAWIREQIQ
ncbi:MAG TPA: hypothetical protein VM142_13620 [Acidimicrobiales bacterium]|nr:hypothetical protein [Acidimicrobiales bacterium]